MEQFDYKKVVDEALQMASRKKKRPDLNPVFQRTRVLELFRDVGDSLLHCTFENYRTPEEHHLAAKKTVQYYANDIDAAFEEPRQLFLYGTCGAGKDHLTMACAKAALEKGYSVRCISGPSFRSKLRDSIGGDGEAAYLRPYLECDFLWISDPVVDGKPMTAYQSDVFYLLVDQRWRNNKPMWVTMNCAEAAEAEEDLGAAVFDRLRHRAVTHYFNWPTMRKKHR